MYFSVFSRLRGSRTPYCGKAWRLRRMNWSSETVTRTTRNVSSMAPLTTLWPTSTTTASTEVMQERMVRRLELCWKYGTVHCGNTHRLSQLLPSAVLFSATCYGNGTYFAVSAKYSAQDTYSRPNQNGEKCMYLCRVLTGDFTTGHQNMIVPPAKGAATSTHKYDSVVDRMVNPSMYIIFHDSQAYPEYLITFK